MRVNERLATAWSQLKPHLPWVAVVLALTAVGQWFELRNGVTAIVSSDGFIYMHDAHALPGLSGLVDPTVPPGYPIFLAAVFAVGGRDNVLAVLLVQSILLVAALLELYSFLVVATAPRWLASTVAGCLAASTWLAQWERYVLTELLSFWLIATMLLLTARWIRRPSTGAAIAAGLVAAALPLVRPALAFVPLTILVVLLARSLLTRTAPGRSRIPAMALLLFLVVSYLPVGGYVTANALVNDCYCYTNISNLNLFGKIWEYDMQRLPADSRFATVAQELHDSTGLNQFLAANPDYAIQNYAPLGDYARSQMLRYPGLTARRTVSELRKVLTLQVDHAVYVNPVYACPGDSVPSSALETEDAVAPPDLTSCTAVTLSVGTFAEVTNTLVYFLVVIGYATLPPGLLLGFLLVFMRPARDRSWAMLLASAVASAVVFSAAVGGYESFDRLKLPADGAALGALALFLAEMGWLAKELVSSARPRSVPAPA